MKLTQLGQGEQECLEFFPEAIPSPLPTPAPSTVAVEIQPKQDRS